MLQLFTLISLVMAVSPAYASLNGATFAEVMDVGVKKPCSKNDPRCKSAGAVRADVEFGHGGCLDEFGGAVHQYDSQSKTLYVAGIRLTNAESKGLKCKEQPTTVLPITLYGASSALSVSVLTPIDDRMVTTPAFVDASFVPGKVHSLENLCKSARCKARGMRANVVFKLSGCFGGFGGAAMQYDRISKTLYVVGIGIHKRERRVACVRQPTYSASFEVPEGDQDMKVIVLSEAE